jgi:hypothetical protein
MKRTLLLLSAAFAVLPAPVAGSTPNAWLAPELIPAHEIGTPAPAHPPVFDAEGDAFLVWTEAKLSIKESVSLEYRVRTSMRPADGRWQRAETLSRLGLNPEVAADARGDEIAVWEGFSGIQAALRPVGGNWLAPQTVTTPGSGDPQVASDASGDAIVVARGRRGADLAGTRAVLRSSGADMFFPAQAISARERDFQPRMSMNARGDAVVAWVRQPARRCLVEAAFRPANGRWSRPRVLSNAHAGCAEDHNVAIDGRGDAVVTWLAQRGRTQFVESASRSANGRWTAQRVLAKGPLIDETVDIEMDARGGAMVVWQEQALKGKGSTTWMRIRPVGRDWGLARKIPGANAGTPSLAVDPRGDALLAWWSNHGIEAAARPVGGHWQKPYPVSGHERTDPGADPGAEGGLAALDARGDAMVTWQNKDGIVTAWHPALFP